jgi:lysophospholipase L1-like esterase
MKIMSIIIVFLLLFEEPQQKITLHLIGDSTCALKADNKRPETGWGEKFKQFFNKDIDVRNYAVNGRSTRSFIEEHRWDSVLLAVRPGDYVFIQFGHNDEVPTKKTYTTPEEFKAYLVRYISEARAKKATPILLTPVSRRRFDEQGNFFDTHGEYGAYVRQVADETKVAFIDMQLISMAILVRFGKDESTKLFLHCAPGECSNYPNGVIDDTHFSDLGATTMAEALAKAIANSNIPLKDHIHKP